MFGTFVVTQVYAFWAYSRWKQRTFRQRIEERAAQLALEPMMLAERDRYAERQKVAWIKKPLPCASLFENVCVGWPWKSAFVLSLLQ